MTSSRDPDGASLTSGAAARTQRLHCPGSSLALPGAFFSILYAPVSCWLHLLADGWRLPWIVQADRSGWSVLLERDDA